MNPLRSLLVFLMLVPALGQAITREQARASAIAFFTAIGADIPSTELRQLTVSRYPDVAPDRRWEITLPDHVGSIDDHTGAVSMYEAGRLYSQAMGGPESRSVSQRGRPFFASEAVVIQRARQLLAKLGWPNGPAIRHAAFPQPDPTGNIPRCLLTVSFDDRPHGYQTQGAGNTSSITFDSLTGEIVMMCRSMGYRYDPGQVNISPQQAIAAARTVTEVGASPEVDGPIYQNADVGLQGSTSHITRAGQRAVNRKICSLVYIVRGVDRDVLVSVNTGEVLCDYNPATGSEPLAPKAFRVGSRWWTFGTRRKLDPPPSPLPVIILIAIPIVAVGVAGALLFRRKAPH